MKKFLILSLSLLVVFTGCTSVEDAKGYAQTFTDSIEEGSSFVYEYSDEGGWEATLTRDSNSNYMATFNDGTDDYTGYLIDGKFTICTDSCNEVTDVPFDIDSVITDYLDYVLDTFSGDYNVGVSTEDDSIIATVDIYYEDEEETDGIETYKIEKDGSSLSLNFDCENEDACYSYDETTTIKDVDEIVLPS